MKILLTKKNLIKRLTSFGIYLITLCVPLSAFAEENPFSSTGNGIKEIMFGAFGLSLCSINIGVTFVLAKAGKVTWDRFVYITFCTAGFIGTPAIVLLIAGWVGK